MKIRITISFLVGAVMAWHSFAAVMPDKWLNKDLSAEERNELVAAAKKEPFEQIAPLLLKAFIDYQPFYGINPHGDTPWNNDRLEPRDRAYLMASAVWNHHMTPRDELAKAKYLLSLLMKATGRSEKNSLINVISHDQWCPDAEKVLLGIANDKNEDLGLRRSAVSALLGRCDLNTYMPYAIEIILADKKGLPRNQAFNFTLNQGNRLFTLSAKNRQAVLVAGFEIISELSDKELQTGYFVARRLGFILKIHDEFAPDQDARRYKGEHGLTEEFFVDTVKNALKWYSKNKKELESN